VRPAVIVKDIRKRFKRRNPNRPHTFQEAVISGWKNMTAANTFWALEDISFTVLPGQMLGVIGNNGAGKSTLVSLLSGVIKPDAGSIEIAGRIGALLDVGLGFNPELTGRDNARIGSVVSGLRRAQVAERLDAIFHFAELEQFVENPLRTYSTGMRMRLAIAIALHTDPDVMLVDECLSVGDQAFQAKCLERIALLRKHGCAVVFVSHNLEQVREHCDRVLRLHKGKLVAYGDPDDVIDEYESDGQLETPHAGR
jgi:lipopolysaccharide transport system ATP-binding protein